MGRQISHALRVLLYLGFPATTAAVGVYATYRATQLTGSMADRAYVIGIALILGTWAWTATRSARQRASSEARLEGTIQELTKRVRNLEKDRDEVRQVLNTHAATALVLEAVDCPPGGAPPWTRLNHPDAPVIRMDPHGSDT